MSFTAQAGLGVSESLPDLSTTTSTTDPKDMAHSPIYVTPVYPLLVHVIPRPKTGHPSHPPPGPPYFDHYISLLIVRLRLARPKL